MCGRTVVFHLVVYLFFGLHRFSCIIHKDYPGRFSVTCKNIPSCPEQFQSSEGIRDFHCFGTYSDAALPNKIDFKCTWKSGEHTMKSTSYSVRSEQKARGTCLRANVSHSETEWISRKFPLKIDYNMTAYLFVNETCSVARFSGQPQKMVRCGPPVRVNFTRSSGQIVLRPFWRTGEAGNVQQYSIMYKELNSTEWNEVQSMEGKSSLLEDMKTSQFYDVRVQCVKNEKCAQCPSSQVISVPPELTDAPVVKEVKDISLSNGQREVIVRWERQMNKTIQNYNVMITKASGELFSEDRSITATRPVLRLILSHSAYNISIQAQNAAGKSPYVHKTLEPIINGLSGQLNVSIKSNNSFSLAWSSTVAEKYCCYSVEWWVKGESFNHKPFYENNNNYKVTISGFFKAYKRYKFFLHTRPDKETCNLKQVNSSESTYGHAEAYFTEGTPLSAPGSLSSSNVTQSSFVITWSPVSEEDLRGFLLGYIIRYAEDNEGKTEKNITVQPGENSYEFLNLRGKSNYRVQLSAYTAAGEGVRSLPIFIQTKPPDSLSLGGMVVSVIVGIFLLLLAVHLSCQILKRVKKLLWPNIPNPGNSNVIQKIEGIIELDILEPLNRQKVHQSEEWDSSSLYVIESRKEKSPVSSPSHSSQGGTKPGGDTQGSIEEHKTTSIDLQLPLSPQNSSERDSKDDEAVGATHCEDNSAVNSPIGTGRTNSETNHPGESVDTKSPTAKDSNERSAPALISDYTTMELFQQATMAVAECQSNQPERTEMVPTIPGQDYIRQSHCHEVQLQQSGPDETCSDDEHLTIL